MLTRANRYGPPADVLLRRRRRGGPVHARGGARVRRPAGDQRADPPARAGAGGAAVPPRPAWGRTDRGGRGAAAARQSRARSRRARPRHDRIAARRAPRAAADRRLRAWRPAARRRARRVPSRSSGDRDHARRAAQRAAAGGARRRRARRRGDRAAGRAAAAPAARALAEDAVVLAVPREHPLSRSRTIAIAALRGQPMIALTRGTGLRATLEGACRDAGFAPRIIAETSQLGHMVELVAAGLGVAVMPGSALAGAELAVLRITRPRLLRRTALAWNQVTTTPAGRAFLALAEARLRLDDGE